MGADGSSSTDTDLKYVAAIATVIDYLNGDIEGIKPSPLNSPPSTPAEPNTDPSPITTEALQRLGSLGLQSIDEIKGYKIDSQGHFLVFVNSRFADTGWTEGDSHVHALKVFLDSMGVSVPRMT